MRTTATRSASRRQAGGRRRSGGAGGGLGFPGVLVDGSDPLACYAAAKEAHDRARTGEGPTLIEARVVRLTSHSSDDDQRRYRDPAEVEALKDQDPIPRFAGQLREWGLPTDERDGSCGVRPRSPSTSQPSRGGATRPGWQPPSCTCKCRRRRAGR